MSRILCLDDFETAAAQHLPRPLFGYIAGAAENNQSLKDNRQAFSELSFVPRAMVDVSGRTVVSGFRHTTPESQRLWLCMESRILLR